MNIPTLGPERESRFPFPARTRQGTRPLGETGGFFGGDRLLTTVSRGIIGLIQLAATLVLAVPVALLGLQFLTRGELVAGSAFLAIAAGMVLVEKYVLTPRDVPGMLAERVVARVAKEPEPDAESDRET